MPVRAIRSLVLAALASAPASAQLQKTKFYLPENLPKRPAEFERAYAATVDLEIPNEGRICSAAVVSDDGYLLTDLHCVLHCLEDKGWLKDGRATREKGEGYEIVRIREDFRAPKDMSCENLVWDEAGVRADNPRVVLLGKAKANFSEEKADILSESAVQAVRENMKDFALLKFELPHPVACLPAAAASPAAGQAVWGIGFPSFTMRYDGYDSSGYKKHISPGIVRKSIREDPYLRGLILDPARWSVIDCIYADPDLLLSDIDLMEGNSGGPLVDASGRLAGLTWGSVAHDGKKELHATALGLRIEALRREIAAGLGEDKAREIFSCPENAASGSASLPAGIQDRARRSLRLPPRLNRTVLDAPPVFFDGVSSR